MMVMLFTGIGMIILTSVMKWTSTNSQLTDRNNQYYTSVSAAEAATEKVLGRITMDYVAGGDQRVTDNFATYSTLVPTSSENPFWGNYRFSNGRGTNDRTYILRMTNTVYKALQAKYAGLNGYASDYRILSNARPVNSLQQVGGAVQQDVQLAGIPIFQFAVFYGMSLEVNPGAPMNILGRVHSNGDIWNGGASDLTYWSGVTAVGTITKTRHPLDPAGVGGQGTVTYIQPDQKKSGAAPLSLPIGSLTNNIHQIIDVPPAGESPTSDLGYQRYYNKADLLISVLDNSVVVAAKDTYANVSNSIPFVQATFMTTNKTFFDQREGKTVKVTEIDVDKLGKWSSSNPTMGVFLKSKFGSSGKELNSIYVSDRRTVTSSELAAVRIINGEKLPTRGLTVATENPLYVLGHFNAPNPGSTNTSSSRPASLVCDALTALSASWNDTNSTASYTNRPAVDTTINAAMLTGIVSTTNSPSRYSGGVQNVARFLEDWSNRTLTYNGSIVVLFDSTKATGSFQQPGRYYSIPNRNFNFDQNFTTQANLPPGTPELRAPYRTDWKNPPINTINYVQTSF